MDCLSVIPFTFLGSHNKCYHFYGLPGRYRWPARLKKVQDRSCQRFIPAKSAQYTVFPAAIYGSAKSGTSLAHAPRRSDTSILPDADHIVEIGGRGSRNRSTARAHNCI